MSRYLTKSYINCAFNWHAKFVDTIKAFVLLSPKTCLKCKL